MLKTLVGHVSAATAYVQPDYPYGRTLRCKRRVWVETKPGHGQRVVFQTNDPKRSYEHWNAPKAGTYSALVAIAIEEDPASPEYGYVSVHAFTAYRGRAELEEFLAAHGEAVDPKVAAGWRAAYDRQEAKKLASAKAACAQALAESVDFEVAP